MDSLLSVDQAIAILDATPASPREVAVPLQESAGLVLAEDIRSDRPYPPFDKSLMDGYALRAADVTSAPCTLPVAGETPAGRPAHASLPARSAIAIMTGAPLPPDADAVVPVEETELRGDTVIIKSIPQPNRYIARRASDFAEGGIVLRRGMRLDGPQLAVAATVGAATVKVFAAPRVAILSTGDEVIPFDQPPQPHQIRNSNNVLLSALLRKWGCRVVDLGLVPDDPPLIRLALLKGLQLDALLVTGGMSMGRHDHVPRLLRELGLSLHVTKLRIKPGKPFVYATAIRATLPANTLGPADGTCHVFGLPGNPVSAFVCTLRLASRTLARLAGGAPVERWLPVTLDTPLPANGPREFYQPVALDPTRRRATVLPYKGSADLFTLAQAGALLRRRENELAHDAGATVDVLELL